MEERDPDKRSQDLLALLIVVIVVVAISAAALITWANKFAASIG
jgi:hypothetical protein